MDTDSQARMLAMLKKQRKGQRSKLHRMGRRGEVWWSVLRGGLIRLQALVIQTDANLCAAVEVFYG